jgi:hypothetical protein
MPKSNDAYVEVQRELDAALVADDPRPACARATILLARVAAGVGFDRARHRAIQGALRSLERQHRLDARISPLVTR